ncbi:MAG: RNA polymerase sigma factor [Bdellovibrionaceae bacterium]|nr:RNA polymerase sigma factor [Pseudobdellovibrionaceae bacterium]
MLSDNDLYLQLKIDSKKESAFRTLYDRYSSSLFRFIYRFTLNQQIAEELLHDIFIQLLDDKYNHSEGNLQSWLFTVAKNKSLNHTKKASFETSDDLTIAKTASDSDLEYSFINHNLLKNLSLLESRLPTDLRQTWNLKKQGLDYLQISQALSIPVGTVKSRFSRLVDHLKKEFNL